MQIIADALSHTSVGRPVSFGNLTMFPLLNGGEEIADYLTLDDAIRQGQAVVTEVSESGSVPELSFTNKRNNLGEGSHIRKAGVPVGARPAMLRFSLAASSR